MRVFVLLSNKKILLFSRLFTRFARLSALNRFCAWTFFSPLLFRKRKSSPFSLKMCSTCSSALVRFCIFIAVAAHSSSPTLAVRARCLCAFIFYYYWRMRRVLIKLFFARARRSLLSCFTLSKFSARARASFFALDVAAALIKRQQQKLFVPRLQSRQLSETKYSHVSQFFRARTNF